jgi:exodeoxyribonuclease V alpha subunit
MKERIEGFVDYIKFYDENTGWTVLSLELLDGRKEMVTIVQENKIDIGMYFEFSGNWIKNKKFGNQFKAIDFFRKKPDSLDSFKKYLSKGNLYGIGPILAEKIIEEFKEKTLDIFENNIEKLLKIDGISKKKIERIKLEWKKDENVRKGKLFLKKLNLQDNIVKKITDLLEDKTVDRIKENPYSLISLVDGFSFNMADSIAMKLGLNKDHPERLFYGLFFILKESLVGGHTWIDREELINKTLRRLSIKDRSLIEFTLNELKENEFIESYKKNRISTKRSFYSEKSIVENLKRLSLGETELPPNIKEVIEGERLSSKIILSEEQENAVHNILKNKISILTGGAGVGKTTTVNLILKVINTLNHQFMLTAPTGRASQRMQEVTGFEVQTIHRLLSWSPEIEGFEYNSENRLKSDFIIIDESSMIDSFLMSDLLEAISDNTQVLFIGDPNQLPSVGIGSVLKDLINSKKVPIFKLTKIFRQSDDAIIVRSSYDIINKKYPLIPSLFENPDLLTKKDCFFIESDFYSKDDYLKAHDLRKKGEIKKETKLELKEWNSLSTKEKNGMIDLSKTNHINYHHSIFYNKNPLDIIKLLVSDIIPKKLGNDLEIQILTPMKKGKLGSKNLNKEIQNLVNPSKSKDEIIIKGISDIRKGDRVIQTRNNYKLDLFNGDIGNVTDVYKKNNLKIETYNKIKFIETIEDVSDLDLSYSITIHKSQGSEFDIVIIPVTWEHINMLYNNLFYTAITRGKSKVFFVGNREAFWYAINNKKEVIRNTNLFDLLIEK